MGPFSVDDPPKIAGRYTYFGDVRDVYEEISSLGFDAIGLDFVEGKKSLELVKSGFPKNTLLFAGLVNGKNIWRTNFEKQAALLAEIKKWLTTLQKLRVVIPLVGWVLRLLFEV